MFEALCVLVIALIAALFPVFIDKTIHNMVCNDFYLLRSRFLAAFLKKNLNFDRLTHNFPFCDALD